MAITESQHRQRLKAGRAAGDAHKARARAVERIVRESRRAQGLPDHISDVAVLERVAALLANGELE